MRNPKLKCLSVLISASLFIGLSTVAPEAAKAQRAMSLSQMNCSTTSAESGVNAWITVDADATIGREIYTAVAVLRYGWEFLGSNYIPSSRTAGAVCRITQPGATPRFRTLRLAFGMAAENSYTDESDLIRLDVFVDGNQVDSQEITQWEPGYITVNIENARSIALEASCLSGQRNVCPSVVFTQTLLEQ